MRVVWLGSLVFLAAGCAGGIKSPCCGTASEPAPKSVVVQENKISGTVDKAWVEPMYDTVKVPAQIDPTNTYYRPSHQEVVEIRPERFENVRYDNEKKQDAQQQGGR